jgi:hypothetical protein
MAFTLTTRGRSLENRPDCGVVIGDLVRLNTDYQTQTLDAAKVHQNPINCEDPFPLEIPGTSLGTPTVSFIH